MGENMKSSEAPNQAGKLVTLAAAVGLATVGFADRANSYTQGVCPPGAEFGIAFIPKVPGVPGDNELLVGPDGKPCAVFTPEEMKKMQEQDRGDDRENSPNDDGGEDPDDGGGDDDGGPDGGGV